MNISAPLNPSLTAGLLTASTQPALSVSTAEVRTPGRRGPRGTRKISAQATQLEAVDDTFDPLGPLGEVTAETSATPTDEAPAPPQKESLAGRPTSTFSPTSSGAGLADSVNLEEDGGSFRGPPPVQPPADVEGPKRQTQPSMSVEQAAKPTFEISVGDPHKVGDLTSSHIVYQVRTRVIDSYPMKGNWESNC